MLIKELVDPSFLNIPSFSDSLQYAVTYMNQYSHSVGMGLIQLRPKSLQRALTPFRINKLENIKLLMIGLEPPHTSIYPKGWYYTGIPFDTPLGVDPLRSTLLVEEVFPPSTYEGSNSRLEAVCKQYGILFYNCLLVGAVGCRELFLPGFLPLTLNIASFFTNLGTDVAIVNERLFRLVKGKVKPTYLHRIAPPCPSCQEVFRRDITSLNAHNKVR